MDTPANHPHHRKEEVLFIDDGYDTFIENGPAEDARDILIEARMLTSLANSHGSNNQYIAILHTEDRQRLFAYQAMGYVIHTMGENRSEELKTLIAELVYKIKQRPPCKLITASRHPAFNALFSTARRAGVEVCAWLPGQRPPNPFRSYDTRKLADLLLPVDHANTVVVRLDVENHLISLFNMGQIPETKAYLDAVRTLTADLGSVISIQACADWKRLRELFNRDYQAEFEENGVRTLYHTHVPGKNTSDIALTGSVCEALEQIPEANVFVLGTGDADFLPLIETIHTRGKKALLIALRGSLSPSLAAAANEVRYLDPFISKNRGENQPATQVKINSEIILAMRLANFLRLNRWKYAYYNRLPAEISPEDIEKGIENGLLQHHQPRETQTVALNLESITGRQIMHFVHWVTKCLMIYLDTRGKEFCDSKFLYLGMQHDRRCRELQIGQTWKDALAWLEAAEQAGVLRRGLRQDPHNDGQAISTWWPAEEEKNLKPDNGMTSEEGYAFPFYSAPSHNILQSTSAY